MFSLSFPFFFKSPCHFRAKNINKCKTLEKNYWWLWDGQLLFSPNQMKTSNPEVLCRLQGSEGSECRVPALLLCDVHLKQLAPPEEPARAPCFSQGWNLAPEAALAGPGPWVSPPQGLGSSLVLRQAQSQSLPCLAGLRGCCSAGGTRGLCLLLWLGTLGGHVLNAPLGKNLKCLCHTMGSAAVLVPFSVSIASLCSCWFTQYPFSSHSRRWQGLFWPGANSVCTFGRNHVE